MSFDINPLNVLGKRSVRSMPVHFAKTKLSPSDLLGNDIVNWVEAKLKGRYSIATIPSIDQSGKMTTSTFLGFEDQKELTYFILACPYLRRN
jgi:hypothetical protein